MQFRFRTAGPGVAVSGNFFGTNNHDGSWTITGIDATYNRIEVSGIVAVGLDPHFLCNNRYYVSGYAPYAVDYYGIDFAVPGISEVTLCSYTAAGGCGSGGYASILWNGGGYEFTQVSQSSFGPVIPEPTTLACSAEDWWLQAWQFAAVYGDKRVCRVRAVERAATSLMYLGPEPCRLRCFFVTARSFLRVR